MKLDLGCSSTKPPDYIGIDIVDFSNLYSKDEFFLGDVNKRLPSVENPFEDNSFEEIKAMQLIEHLDNNNKVSFILEIYRLLKDGGIFIAEFPPVMCSNGWANIHFFTDPTHTAWWVPETFKIFDKVFRESHPDKIIYENSYGIKTNFKVEYRWITDSNCHVEMVKEMVKEKVKE